MPHIALLASLSALWAICFFWQRQENRALSRMLALSPVPPDVRKRVLAQAQARSLQFLLTLAGCGVLTGVFDWKLSQPIPQAEPLTVAKAEAPSLSGALVRLDGVQNETTIPAPADSLNAFAAPIPAPALPTTAQMDAQAKVYALFSPTAGGQQGDLDDLKRRYEELFVQYLFLTHCGFSDPQDYQALSTSLLREMASLNAPGRLSYDILTAARGTYDEVYAKTPCDSDAAKDGRERFRRYVDYLRTRDGSMK